MCYGSRSLIEECSPVITLSHNRSANRGSFDGLCGVGFAGARPVSGSRHQEDTAPAPRGSGLTPRNLVVLRPLSWSTTVPQQEVVAMWTHFRRAPRTAAPMPTTSADSP